MHRSCKGPVPCVHCRPLSVAVDADEIAAELLGNWRYAVGHLSLTIPAVAAWAPFMPSRSLIFTVRRTCTRLTAYDISALPSEVSADTLLAI